MRATVVRDIGKIEKEEIDQPEPAIGDLSGSIGRGVVVF